MRAMPSDAAQTRFPSADDHEVVEYRAVCGAAVVGLLLGLASPLAIVSLSLLFVPIFGAAASLFALWRIERMKPMLLGRKAAVAGLVLAVFSAAAAPAEHYGHRWLIRREATQFAEAWFGYLAEGRPEKAYLLTLDPAIRPAMDPEAVAEFYQRGPRWQEDLEAFTKPAPPRELPNPVPELLRLGPVAAVRYEETVAQGIEHRRMVAYLAYSVRAKDAPGDRDGAAEEGAEPLSLLLRLVRERLADGRAAWRLDRIEVAHPAGPGHECDESCAHL
jgi:hypothetical protein